MVEKKINEEKRYFKKFMEILKIYKKMLKNSWKFFGKTVKRNKRKEEGQKEDKEERRHFKNILKIQEAYENLKKT